MVAMVTIETPGFKRKRLLTLDKNFLVPSTILLNPGNNYAIVITITIITGKEKGWLHSQVRIWYDSESELT